MVKRELWSRWIRAIEQGSLGEVEALLDLSPELLDAKNAHQNSGLGAAVAAGRYEVVRLLIDRGTRVEESNGAGRTLMDAAAHGGVGTIAEALLEAGLALRAHHASQLGWTARLSDMLDRDPDRREEVDHRGGTPLHAAGRGAQLEAARLLLKRGADVHALNQHGIPPVGDAAEAKALDVVRLYLDHGADPNSAGGHSGGTVLHRALMLREAELAKLLLDRGADPDRQDNSGKTALHQAAVVGRLDLVELVLAVGPNLSLRTLPSRQQPFAETALEYVRRRGKKKIVACIERS